MPAAEDSPAIRKLGPLFRLTEVHLWDNSYAAGAVDGQKHWRSAGDFSAYADSHKDKTVNKPSNTDEGHLSVEDLELANLMGSLGLPVSFSTSKVKKNTASKGTKKGRQAPREAATSQIDGAVRICVNTEDRESAVQSMTILELTNSCNSSGTALDYNEFCHDGTEKMLKDGSSFVEEQESGCSIICPAENQHELVASKLHVNMSDPVKPKSPIQENQAAEGLMQWSEEMLGHNSVDGEPRSSCLGVYLGERLSTREDQTSVETVSLPHDNNDADHGACPSSARPPSVDGHAQSFASNFYYDYGDWRVLWDPFYSRYYFYNIQTQESTWCPPEGLEDFASYCITDTTKEVVELGSQDTSIAVQENNNPGDDGNLNGQTQHNLSELPDEETINQSMIATIHEHEVQETENKDSDSMTGVSEIVQEVASTKKKKRIRRSQSYHSCQDMSGSISSDIIKYWTQRYSLFSLFDNGIKMDEEGWFSVTPEPIARHHASRVGAGVVIDCFTGVGGNAIQFATTCKHVIALDIDPQKIDCAQHNASVYGVHDHIDFIVGDFISIAPHLKGETAFMSPPWGGPDYAKVDIYDMETMLKPCDGYSLFKLATMIASRVVMFLPRNIDLNQLADISLSIDHPWAVEVEKNFLNGKLKAITAYFEKQDG